MDVHHQADDREVIPIEEVLGKDWELPEGFAWEYREGMDGGGSQSVSADGVHHGQTIISSQYRRAVGPWEICRKRKTFDYVVHDPRRSA
jgi:hypothetical protein